MKSSQNLPQFSETRRFYIIQNVDALVETNNELQYEYSITYEATNDVEENLKFFDAPDLTVVFCEQDA